MPRASIVVLELEPNEGTTLSEALEEAGFRVSVRAEDGLGAVDSPDAVVIGTGRRRERVVELLTRLRASGYAGAIVVLGADAETEGVDFLEHGADDFVSRPVRGRELVARLRAVLRRIHGHERLEHGPLTIDRARRIAFLRGRPLPLTAREYALLTCLAEAGGDMVRRSDLLAAVWGPEGDHTSNLVQVNLSRLRDKLGTDASLVETVRRGGYRLRW